MVSQRQRRFHGYGFMEVAFIGSIMTMLALFSLNIGLIALGSSLNDRACRDAARAAAQGTTANQALLLANAALRSHPADGFFVTPSTLSANFVYQDYGGSPPPDTSPYVTVTTTNQVRIPAPFLFTGQGFGTNGMLTFSSTYTFPIVKVQLYL